ncbi:hypothetical protein KEJ51_02740 [Candidatus Bathyarchaeota archaeon]|nr:hypothetical protein [Candidatus Bathyarchaeota archaeon]MBS7629031.1 hypothetical protein [Candidatus Bathyarchaeota archaeon]
MNSPRSDFRDRDFIETLDGYFFTVVGNTHPAGRVLSYLKYYPEAKGKWRRLSQTYDRAIKYYDIPHLKDAVRLVSERCSRYLYRDDLLNITFTAVPLEAVGVHYKPEEKLKSFIDGEKLDPLQKKALDLALKLSRNSDIQLSKFGVTGSILIGLHQQEFSDVDLTIYGKQSGLRVRECMIDIFNSGDQELVRSPPELNPTPARESRLRLMNREQLKIFYERKWNRGLFRGTPFSINPVLEPSDVKERYGDYKYVPQGIVEAEGTVTDASESIFVPARYVVSDVKVKSGLEVKEILEVVSFDRDYGDVALEGERISVRGKLERVERLRGRDSYFRIVVGSIECGGADYIKIDV